MVLYCPACAEGSFPASEGAAGETLALPVYPELTEQQMGQVVDAVRDFFVSPRA